MAINCDCFALLFPDRMSYHYPMKALTLVFVLLAASSRADDALDRACGNELGLFCHGLAGPARARCLREHRDASLPQCREALSELPPEAYENSVSLAASPDRQAFLVGARGAVYLHRAGTPEGEFVAVSSGTPLLTGDWLRVGLDGAAELAFDGTTAIGLSSGTDLSLTSLSQARTELSLALGTLSAKVSKLIHGHTFRVRTATAVAAVRGTEFVVEQDAADGDSRVAVVDEGVVTVTAASGGEEVYVRPHEETAVRRSAERPEPVRALTTMKARAEAYTAFRSGAERTAKTWTRATPAAMAQARAYLATRPVLNTSRLTGVSTHQRTASPTFRRSPSTNTRTGNHPSNTHGGTNTHGTNPGGTHNGGTHGSTNTPRTYPAGTQPGTHTGGTQPVTHTNNTQPGNHTSGTPPRTQSSAPPANPNTQRRTTPPKTK